MLTFLSYATTDVLLYGIYREFFPYYSPLRAKTHGWFLKKTFLGVLDAWILHNRDQNFIFPVILTRYIHDIANQLLTRHLPSTPLSQVDEWTAKFTPFSIQGRLLEFFQIMAAKPLKNPYCLEKVTFKLSQKGEKTKIRKEKPKVVYPVALVMAFLAAENENWQLEYLPQADFGRVLKRFLLSVRTKSITKNFLNWKLGPLFVFVVLVPHSCSKATKHTTVKWTICPIPVIYISEFNPSGFETRVFMFLKFLFLFGIY